MHFLLVVSKRFLAVFHRNRVKRVRQVLRYFRLLLPSHSELLFLILWRLVNPVVNRPWIVQNLVRDAGPPMQNILSLLELRLGGFRRHPMRTRRKLLLDERLACWCLGLLLLLSLVLVSCILLILEAFLRRISCFLMDHCIRKPLLWVDTAHIARRNLERWRQNWLFPIIRKVYWAVVCFTRLPSRRTQRRHSFSTWRCILVLFRSVHSLEFLHFCNSLAVH